MQHVLLLLDTAVAKCIGKALLTGWRWHETVLVLLTIALHEIGMHSTSILRGSELGLAIHHRVDLGDAERVENVTVLLVGPEVC